MNESNNEERTDRPNFKQRVTAEWARFRELAWWKRLVHPLAIVASLSIIALFCLLAAGFIRLILPRSGSIRFWRAQDYVRPESAADRAALLLAEVYATQAFIEIIGSLVLVITVIAALYTARQTQRSLELGREQLRISQDGQITDRFAKAIEMLGATLEDGRPRMEVRLGGIFALERLAKDSCRGDQDRIDWCRDHWPVMQVLAAYLRSNSKIAKREMEPQLDIDEADQRRDEMVALVDVNGGRLKQRVHEIVPPMYWIPGALRLDIEAILRVLSQRNEPQRDSEREMNQRIDLRATHLEGAILPEVCLAGADLRGTRLNGANMRGAFLEGADLRDAHLQGANINVAQLEGADFRGSHLKGAHLEDANMRGAFLEGADLRDARLRGARLEGARFWSFNLEGTPQNWMTVEGMDPMDAHFEGMYLTGRLSKRLEGLEDFKSIILDMRVLFTRLEGADLSSASLPSANLNSMNLNNTNMQDANLEHADLGGADLKGANLKGANLKRANLEGANLEGANLEGANLELASLDWANFESAKIVATTGLGQWQLDSAWTNDETVLSSGLSPDGFPFSRSIRPDGLSRFEFECVGNRYICAYISEGDKIISISVGGQSEDEVCLVSLLERFESASPANALRFAAIITGVTDLEFVRYLGDQWIPASSGDHLGYDHRYYVHLRLSSATPNEWTYTSLKAKSTDPDPIERSFQWIRLDPNNPPDLPEGLGHRLPDLLKSMEMDKESK